MKIDSYMKVSKITNYAVITTSEKINNPVELSIMVEQETLDKIENYAKERKIDLYSAIQILLTKDVEDRIFEYTT